MRIVVELASQSLVLEDNGQEIVRYAVSTAKNGPGEREGSGCTPRGEHRIRARIGAGAACGTVFRSRRPTGEIWTPELAARHPDRDWILSRILWLCGCEPGRNRGRDRCGSVDTMRRYIYIHGTPDDQPMGVPLSHGCIRMRNHDVIALFDRVAVGTPVRIVAPDDRPDAEAPSNGDVRQPERAQVEIEITDWVSAEARVMPLREAVFVIEQQVPPELERDAFDPVCRHAIARTPDGEVVATGRLLPDGHIGRMAVARAWRGRGIGGRVLQALIADARARGLTEVVLNAQLSAEAFYRRHGFAPEGGVFMDAGIEHRAMRKRLERFTR